jgi:hypothetical protein
MIHLILTKKATVEISAKTKEFRLNALNKNFKLSYKNRKPTKSVSRCSPWIMQLSSLLSKIDYSLKKLLNLVQVRNNSTPCILLEV